MTINVIELSPLLKQGCQIFLDTINQNGIKYTKLQINYLTVLKYT
jgi:hypothetical protein